MFGRRLSLRTGLLIAAIMMGYLAMVLVYITGHIYRTMAVEQQRAALVELLALKLGDALGRLEWQSRVLVMAGSGGRPLVDAFAQKDIAAITLALNERTRHHLITAGEIKLKGIYAYSDEGAFLAQSMEAAQEADLSPKTCVRYRPLASRVVTDQNPTGVMSGFCAWDKYPYYVTIVPVGVGYIHVIVDPLPHLAAAERDLGMPLKITLADGTLLHTSSSWSDHARQGQSLAVDYRLNEVGREAFMTVSAVKPIPALYDALSETGYRVMIVAAGITVIMIFAALWIAQKTVVTPLQALVTQLRRLRRDESQYGKQIATKGNAEVYELAKGFNEMTRRVGELYASLEHVAYTDPLTRLPNRALFHDRLEQAIVEARRTGRSFTLFILDLDRFKEVNYTLGHHVGDRLLRQIGTRLTQHIGAGDLAARLGGDEFALMLQRADTQAAVQFARSLLDALGRPFDIDGQSLYLGASLGIAIYPDHGETRNILIQHAEVARYAAKNAKSGYMLYATELDKNRPERLALIGDLRHAVENEEFVLYYQPKVNLRSRQLDGVEALVRWNRLQGERPSPDLFIPIMEQTGQIRGLTHWVLREAMRQCRQWMEAGLGLKVAVNLSIGDLQDAGLATRISSLLAEEGVLPRQLEVEITESSIMVDPARSLDTLKHLAAMGISVAIDDFGTGYASLTYLKRLPARSIKIDKSFVLGMERDQNDDAIVRASIELAHNMGLKVTAEGVESEGLLKQLADHGCDFAQGFFISKPLPADLFSDWVQASTWTLAQRA